MSRTEHYESSVTDDLLERTRRGDQEALGRLFNLHRDYLRRLIETHMENDLRARLDPSDVIQEAQLVVSQRIESFLQKRPATFRVWLRSTAMERLIDLRRRHLAEKRSVHREVPFSDASSMALATNLFLGRPSEDLQRKELTTRVRQAILELKPSDREILMLRHVEELSNAEAAEVLRIEPAASRKRLGRALIRLTRLLSDQGLQLDERYGAP